ncbi:5-oxoprolinase [Saccharomycopsis crataegensis]|uniref:5-oxoprolinase n=1 Tax=Saccharomycopsis crataegensis TaxID=43959 RepID=A0AAV5QTB3_9ASCO|nr:5-oxoprolinase [Saccharomycopsis crataegensis]
MEGGIEIAIDRGGTFTDVVSFIPGKPDYIFKLLSVDPSNYEDANIEGIRRVLEYATGAPIPRNQSLDISSVKSLKLGTTVATNALLERKGERCVFVTTKGFKDSLIIGDQTRPDIFQLNIKRPSVIYEKVVEVNERVTLEDYVEGPQQEVTKVGNNDKLVKGVTGETVRILTKPNIKEVETMLKLIYNQGIKSIAICLLHSYAFPVHEIIIGKIASEIGFTHISLSHELSPMIKYIPRANSSVVDAYLTPEIKKYLDSFKEGLKDGIQSLAAEKFTGVKCQFMKSDGGLIESSKFSGLKAILSGPAGGIVGLAKTCYDTKRKIPLISIDVGGTSTDISRFSGKFDQVLETTTAGITIQSPQLNINTIAAGGGSRLFYQNGLMRVGPESAGAHPGPVCYKKGGFLTITDANLILNRLIPEFFPKIFGSEENESLDPSAALLAFRKLTRNINDESGQKLTIEQVAEGFLNVANESMAGPIRNLTESKGHLLTSHRLVSFGGGGGQCCCFVAFDTLGIDTVLIHKYSSVLSAYGMALADVVEEVQEPASLVLNESNSAKIEEAFSRLCSRAASNLRAQGIESDRIVFERYLNMKYKGTESPLMTSADSFQIQHHVITFTNLHLDQFGFRFEEKDIIIDDIRVRAIGKSCDVAPVAIDDELETLIASNRIIHQDTITPTLFRKVYIDGKFVETPVYKLEDLEIGTQLFGPAIVVDGTQTNVIPINAYLFVLRSLLFIKRLDHQTQTTSLETQNNFSLPPDQIPIDPVLLSILGHRFVDISEQMGHSLQKTAVSTNVKERLDFSCALFDSQANLVASAPHIPVHLGSMSTFVRYQSAKWKGKLKPGDVIVGNHPICGTHLPDITVMTPVFYGDGQIIFYLASRAHHSDIGSILPGSMPPNSRELWQEGAIIHSELLIRDGIFQTQRMIELLFNEPGKYPGCSGTRKLSDNLSDLKAQAAANQKGWRLLTQLVKDFGLNVVLAYMEAIQSNSAATVRRLLKRITATTTSPSNTKPNILQSEDFMDDGSSIKLKITIDANSNSATLDFTGTSPEMYSNMNAPKAITYSAIIYCLRCLVDEDIPLNEGFLRPFDIIIPDDCFLSPSEGAAVVAGNVLTSQRITDVIFKAFGTMADSQGCTNNFTFGIGGQDSDGKHSNGFGYYETIAGGHGAGKFWNGVDAVHTNMTNTKMTDVEVLEKRYPVILREFSIRKESGGKGQYCGGNGAIRDMEFRIPLIASILSERRVISPHGINGGEYGSRGINLWRRQIFKDGELKALRVVNIGGKNSVSVNAGDRIILMTPGGGGYGRKSNNVLGRP